MYCILYRNNERCAWNHRTVETYPSMEHAEAKIGVLQKYDVTPTQYAVALLTIKEEDI